MSPSYSSCHYHPDRPAVAMCERCHRPICSDDKRTFTVESSTRVSYYWSLLRSKTIIHEYSFCFICNATMLRKKAKASKSSLYFIPFIGIVLLGLFILGTVDSFLWGALITLLCFIICVYILSTFINAQADAHDAVLEVFRFNNSALVPATSLSTSSFNQSGNNPVFGSQSPKLNSNKFSSFDKTNDLFTLQCYECGRNLTLQDKFCQNCGNSTHEELVNFYQQAKQDL